MTTPPTRKDVEKADMEFSEDVIEKQTMAIDGLSLEDAAFLETFPAEKKKKLLWKVDIRLVPMLLWLYLITYIDKVNIGNAKIEGLLPSLNMVGNDYNVALAIFFIPYVLGEVPSNMLMDRFNHPSWYLGAMVITWGIIMTCTGTIQNFGELVAIRFLLGLFEAGLFPGAILLISKWYMPNETQTRIALLYTSAASGGAFSGLLAYGIAKMDGIGGYEGWRWIFILEGIITIVGGIMCFFFLIDSPSLSSRWLNDEEIRYLELRQYVRALATCDPNAKKRKVNWPAITAVLTDWKMYFLIFVNWSQAVPNYALKFSMPAIIKGMGYTSANAQLLTIPPYICGALSSYGFAVVADRTSWRMPFILVPQCCVVIGYAILSARAEHIVDNIPLCYFAVCVACFGLYPILPGVQAWNIANCASPAKRSISIAFLICMGNAGGLIGSFIFVDKEAPRYQTGYGTSLAFAATGIVAAIALELLLKRSNNKNAKLTEDEVHQKYSKEQLDAMGDRSPLYKYAL